MNLPVWLMIVPLLTAVCTGLWTTPGRLRSGLGVASAALQAGLAVWLILLCREGGRIVVPLGGWAGNLGIVLVADLLAAIMLGLAALMTLSTLLCHFNRPEHPLRLPLLMFLVSGIQLAFLAGDLFNLFVSFELMLIASYGLLTLEARDVREGLPYFTINLLGGLLFFAAAGLGYGLFGTLNLALIGERAQAMGSDPAMMTWAALLLAIFGIKAGVFPLYYWLPGAYPILPASVGAFYAGMLTKVGVYVIFRFTATVFPPDLAVLHTGLIWVGVATMILGAAGALAQSGFRSILSFHIVSQIGFMILAIGLFTPLSLAAAVLYVAHNIMVKSSLFLVGGLASERHGGRDRLSAMANLWRDAPGLSLLFLCQALSLAGIPPLSGFWGKLAIVIATLEGRHYWLAAITLTVGLLTLVSMLKIFNQAFWSETPQELPPLSPGQGRATMAVIALLALLSLGMGLGAEKAYQFARIAAESALDRAGYQQAVSQILPP